MCSHTGVELGTGKAEQALAPAAELAVSLLLAPQAVVRNVAEVHLLEAISADVNRQEHISCMQGPYLHQYSRTHIGAENRARACHPHHRGQAGIRMVTMRCNALKTCCAEVSGPAAYGRRLSWQRLAMRTSAPAST